MSSILFINNLNYFINNKQIFNKLNLSVENKSFTSIIASNQSGKTLLTKIICAIIPTDNICNLDNISLNKKNVLKYITKIGIVSNSLNDVFLFDKVMDELKYPLENLGYSVYQISKLIKKISKYFEIENILNKNIKLLTESEKSKLSIIIALIHNPKLLVLDDAFNNMNNLDQIFVLKKLKDLNKKGLTILNITSKLDTIYESNCVLILNNYKIEKCCTVEEVFNNDLYLNKLGLKVPLIVDLSLKLKFYNLINNIYYDIDSLEDKLWK